MHGRTLEQKGGTTLTFHMARSVPQAILPKTKYHGKFLQIHHYVTKKYWGEILCGSACVVCLVNLEGGSKRILVLCRARQNYLKNSET